MSKSYTFVRFRDKTNGVESSCWWFVAKTIEDVIEHTEKFLKPRMQTGLDTLLSRSIESINSKMFDDADPNHFGHASNWTECAIQADARLKYGELNPGTLCRAADSLFDTVIKGRLEDVQKRHLYLSDQLVEFAYTDDNQMFGICETIEKDELEYPEQVCLLDEVRYIRWPNGEHWYAKIGNVDITDMHGNQKWISKYQAEEAAKWYIEKYYGHQYIFKE